MASSSRLLLNKRSTQLLRNRQKPFNFLNQAGFGINEYDEYAQLHKRPLVFQRDMPTVQTVFNISLTGKSIKCTVTSSFT